MNIVQTFYDKLATQYHKLFLDWEAATKEQAEILDRMFKTEGFDNGARVLDCACGIGTQAIGLATLGYNVTASDISEEEIKEAKVRARNNNANITFKVADFRKLEDVFGNKFDVVIAMDNALPHMLTKEDLQAAIESVTARVADGGLFVASIRDYDALLADKPPYSPPYIHKTDKGQRVSFQTWDWAGERYKLTQYIIEDEETLQTSRFECEYRGVTRDELTQLLLENGYKKVQWKFPEETGFYQPVAVARK